jgi:hypothetical protein
MTKKAIAAPIARNKIASIKHSNTTELGTFSYLALLPHGQSEQSGADYGFVVP